MKSSKSRLGVLAALVLLEQLVEVVEHLVDRGAVLVGGVLERLLHAGEPLVEQLAAEQVLDLLVVLAGLAAAASRSRDSSLTAAAVEGGRFSSCISRNARSASSRSTSRASCLRSSSTRAVEQLADLLERAVEVVPLQQLAAPLGDPAGQVVEAGLVAAAPAQELAHRPLRRVAGHHVLADRVERLGEVDRGRERVRAAVVAAVAGARARASAVDRLPAAGLLADLAGEVEPLERELDRAGPLAVVAWRRAGRRRRRTAPTRRAPAARSGSRGR